MTRAWVNLNGLPRMPGAPSLSPEVMARWADRYLEYEDRPHGRVYCIQSLVEVMQRAGALGLTVVDISTGEMVDAVTAEAVKKADQKTGDMWNARTGQRVSAEFVAERVAAGYGITVDEHGEPTVPIPNLPKWLDEHAVIELLVSRLRTMCDSSFLRHAAHPDRHRDIIDSAIDVGFIPPAKIRRKHRHWKRNQVIDHIENNVGNVIQTCDRTGRFLGMQPIGAMMRGGETVH